MCKGKKEGNALFNDALNTFYLRLYGFEHMVKDHSYSERGNPLPPHGLPFPINSKGTFFMHHPTYRIAHTTAFVTPVVVHWLEREIAQWVHPMKDRSDDPSHHERTLLPRSYISLLCKGDAPPTGRSIDNSKILILEGSYISSVCYLDVHVIQMRNAHAGETRMNECLTTPQHKNKIGY